MVIALIFTKALDSLLPKCGASLVALLFLSVCGTFPATALADGPRLSPVWPTPNRAFAEGQAIDGFIQPTASGEVKSGLFGCVRSSGGKFHEGVDFKSVERDRRGEPLDDVFAIFGGKVVHVARNAGSSSYGKYVVVEHTGAKPTVYSLYAHLAAVDDTIRTGVIVPMGASLGKMGHTAGGYSIPRDRAHLHLEIGLRLTTNFQSWYDRQGFGSKNEHGSWNGMNLIAFDSLDFYRKCRRAEFNGMRAYINTLDTAATVRVRTRKYPDFAVRYPELVDGTVPRAEIAGWEIDLTGWGFPKRLRPLRAEDIASTTFNEPNKGGLPAAVIAIEEDALEPYACRDIIKHSKRGLHLDTGGRQVLELIFN
ncbi:MAG: M23 family metallopeptidase [Verrucomicrobiota bacterium]|nr:M23 family metallopeptidase [Verrucomicrobiota bacterium]